MIMIQKIFLIKSIYILQYKNLSMRPYRDEKILNLTSQQYQNNKIQKGYMLLNRYEIISNLGFGTYGEVYIAYDNTYDHEKQVAIKIINLKKIYQNNRADPSKIKKIMLREEQNLKRINQINSEHIVKYYQSMLNKEGTIKAIIMERCQGPTLSQYITDLRNQKKGITEQQALKYIYQIAEGLNDLYKLKIMHRDLHPGNIMFHKGKLIIIDLGLSKLITMSQKIEQATVLGNPITVAPQIVDEEHKYGMKVDVWSLGVILYFLLTAGKFPFKIQIQNGNSQKIHQHIRSVLYSQFNKQNRSKSRLSKAKVSENTRNFLQKLLCFYQQKRYSIKQVLNDKIFDNIRTNNSMMDQKQEQETLYKNEEYLNNYMGE